MRKIEGNLGIVLYILDSFPLRLLKWQIRTLCVYQKQLIANCAFLTSLNQCLCMVIKGNFSNDTEALIFVIFVIIIFVIIIFILSVSLQRHSVKPENAL